VVLGNFFLFTANDFSKICLSSRKKKLVTFINRTRQLLILTDNTNSFVSWMVKDALTSGPKVVRQKYMEFKNTGSQSRCDACFHAAE
jgi:hypothetical protein